MHDYIQPLGDCIKEARTNLGLTQVQLAELIDRETRTIVNIENYRGNPKMEVLYPLIRALNIDSNKIFYPEHTECNDNVSELEILISKCSIEDKEALLPICKAALKAIHSRDKIVIK